MNYIPSILNNLIFDPIFILLLNTTTDFIVIKGKPERERFIIPKTSPPFFFPLNILEVKPPGLRLETIDVVRKIVRSLCRLLSHHSSILQIGIFHMNTTPKFLYPP